MKLEFLNTESRIVIHEEPTNPDYGFIPDQRPIGDLLNHGLIALDKQSGPSSHQIVSWVRKILNQDKAGHSGTLDPGVTGLLPIGLGQATKALPIFLFGPKEYVVVARFHDTVDLERLNSLTDEFTGDIFQRPPQRSAVKRDVRTRCIYEIDLLEQKGSFAMMRVLCEAGTYIRKLVYDMGEILGCGGTMVELRRTRVSHLNEKDGLVRLHDLMDAKYLLDNEGNDEKLRNLVKPVEYISTILKSIMIRDSAVGSICHGAQLAVPGVLNISDNLKDGDAIAVLSQKGELVCMATALMSSEEIVEASRGIVCSTTRVIMKKGTYPKLWRSKSQ